jgi:hypothetical protein
MREERRVFAGMALQGLLANQGTIVVRMHGVASNKSPDVKMLAATAVEAADALIAALGTDGSE